VIQSLATAIALVGCIKCQRCWTSRRTDC